MRAFRVSVLRSGLLAISLCYLTSAASGALITLNSPDPDAQTPPSYDPEAAGGIDVSWSFTCGPGNDPTRLDMESMRMQLLDADNELIGEDNFLVLQYNPAQDQGFGSGHPDVPADFGNYGIRVVADASDRTKTYVSRIGPFMVGD